ncbi:hypothetical protein JEQ12_017175, partial [Ovis aries]
KKTVNKSSVKNSAFWCSSRTREDNQDPPLPPRKQKQLFGVALEEVCDNDTLPTPILEMLSFINQKGPFTEGIFRKPASIKSAIALKEKLNAGHKVNFDDESVLVVSSVLKDFLRNIQGSIFSARLYDKWLDVIDEGNEEEKITATQRLVDQLPKANVVFLRHLFGVLHNIEQHSSSSQMTAHDLSLYLTPSILCLLNSGSSAFENVSKKVSVIQFLIENCLKIFGEDITSLFGENSVSCDNSDITDNSEISDKKTVNKNSVKNWAFWCSSRTREDNQHPPLPPRKQKQLFGAPLEDVCDNDTLPTPILEMLSFINQKGPFTEGIFRKPASVKSCRALKKKLNAGHKVNFDDESILVVSSVLKVSLIQFLIENCLKIFGEDITSLFGENSVSCDNSDITDNSEISDKKTVSKSSVKNWAFWCSSRTREDNQHPPLPPRKQKQLFGVALEEVCDNDTLPTPILEMLSFINQKGPFTEGIFRKSASIKSCRALKKKLNAGHKVNFDDESVLVVSSVLKDFLQNIQGSIFSARLYDKWLDVIDQGNEEEKITATQRLVDQLPRANVVLLRYLFGVLHNIEQHSSSNQMTSYNLSVCLAPSILCLLNSGSSAFEKVTKKVSLIQFLIENCLKIFGEDITSLFGENSVSCDNSDITDNSEISDKKTVSKSSVKNWAFWCRSRTREDNQHPPLPPRKQKQLFGVALDDVCDNDTLPTPILEMLSFINQKGPFTEGIFRKSASIKSCRALKKKLNAGHKVNFDDESVLVVSSVLKDFLQNIQGSIFSARLYDKWLDVIDQGNEEEKITATQRLVDQLPKANVVLLRYLFGVLHNIEQHSSSNQMTPYNLSVCLAPCILCLLNSGSSAFEKVTKKVSLIQFLIENCLKIFGEDITSLFGENSVSCDNSDITDNSEISGTTEQSLESKPVRVTMIYEKSVTITVTNSDTVSDVINMSLSKLRITGSKKGYQWVSFGEKKALYPLTGRGHPYGIKMRDVPDTGLLQQGLEGSISGSALQEALLEGPEEIQEQFILKPRHSATNQAWKQQGKDKKTVNKSSVKNSAFWCSSRTREDNQDPPLPPRKQKQLFGAPLEAVCDNDTLPTPILEMLSFINQKGPFTEGIFRKPASIKSAIALKEKLNAGHKVNFDDEPILVVSSVLKVSVIQFLIENCLKIFGEDITSLFGENSVSCDNSDITDNSEISDKKTVNKSSVKNSAFWCSSRTREDNQHPPLPPRKQKQLFGVALEEVCDNDTLPTPILEMLSFINQKGPFTEGIFRKPASIKSAIALKEKLNAGHKVNLDDESVLVVSSVLKDFLRNIQGSIFSARLYDKWLDVIDEGNEEEKITATQRLVDQLPKANVVFLRHLFGVLHNIEQHSSSSQMTAHDLSLYLTPSILCLLNSGSSAFENVSKKVFLIQFLIENCLKIFGEDITSLFGENSVSCDNTDNSEISDKKTVSKSSVKNWAFWCRSRTREDNQHPPLPPRKQKQLFGAPLEDVCDNDTLPTPILEMLSFVNQKGPFTEGIFRKSASIKSCRALKEKLNAGHNVNLDDESVLVVSSVLKDFLQNIQGSIFSARLYDKWLDVIDQGNEEEKITATQRLVDQLPKANVVLLRYLFGVLHNIEQHSSSNQMTPYNLSVCLAPSILCLLNSGSSAFEKGNKKVSLIQFLIENCLKIFGEDITSLFGENSVSCDNSDITDNSEISVESW